MRTASRGRWIGRASLRRIGLLATGACAAVAASPPTALAADPLPDGRAYELVSPYDTDGADLLGAAVFPGGDRGLMMGVAFFAGHPSGVMGVYTVDRTPQGWVPRPLGPLDDRKYGWEPLDGTEDGSRIFMRKLPGLLPDPTADVEFHRLDADGSRGLVASLPNDPGNFDTYAGKSLDGTAFVNSFLPLTDDAPEAAEGERHVYRATPTGPELVTRDESGDPLDCGAGLGDGEGFNGAGR